MADPDLVASIQVDGQIYTYWTDVRVTRIYASSFSDFAFTCAEPGGLVQGGPALKIEPGMRCQVLLAGVKAIDGYVVDRQVGYEANDHRLLIQGRSLTRELARSSANGKQYRGYSFEAIARALAKESGVKVVVKDPPKGWDRAIKQFVANPFATRWHELERIARKRGVQMHDDKDGNLVLSGAPISGASVADLVEGVNILALRGVISDNNVFSKIIAVGQESGSDERFGATVADVRAKSENPLGVPGSVLHVPAESMVDSQDAKTRTDAQTGTSSATDVDLTVTVKGWLKPDGQLWDVRDPLTVRSPMMFPRSGGRMELGVRAVNFLQGPQGSVTVLNLCLPNALSIVSGNVPKGEVPSILNSRGSEAAPEAAT